jgi:hypothetical protein
MSASQPNWTRLRCADAVHARLFDGELIVLDLAKGEYFALDQIGARFWTGLEEGRTVHQIAQEVVAEYDVSEVDALADLLTLGDELVARGLMVRDEGMDAIHDR